MSGKVKLDKVLIMQEIKFDKHSQVSVCKHTNVMLHNKEHLVILEEKCKIFNLKSIYEELLLITDVHLSSTSRIILPYLYARLPCWFRSMKTLNAL